MNIQVGRDAIAESKKSLASNTYLRNAWYCAGWADQLPDGGVLGLTILKEPVVVYREGNGSVTVEPRSVPFAGVACPGGSMLSRADVGDRTFPTDGGTDSYTVLSRAAAGAVRFSDPEMTDAFATAVKAYFTPG